MRLVTPHQVLQASAFVVVAVLLGPQGEFAVATAAALLVVWILLVELSGVPNDLNLHSGVG